VTISQAWLLLQASLDRGFGRCMVLRAHKAVIRKYPNRTSDRIVAPPAPAPGQAHTHTARAHGKWKALDDDGIAAVGDFINPGVPQAATQAMDACREKHMFNLLLC
jgi:DNA-directed RNA polymerase III subunit RPC2